MGSCGDSGPSKVLEGLFVGNYRDSKNRRMLKRFGITHIISILDNPKRSLYDKYYLCITAEDDPDQNLTQFFTVTNDFIHNARLNNDSVLVHCQAGVSRSVTITMAYIMSVTDMNWSNALNIIQAERYIAQPNPGFIDQIKNYEKDCVDAERNRLLRKYPSYLRKRVCDEKWCKDALCVHAVLVSTSPHLFERDQYEGNVCSNEGDSDADDDEDEECPQDNLVSLNVQRAGVRRTKQPRHTKIDQACRARRERQLSKHSEGSSSGEDILINVRMYKPVPKRYRDCEGRFVSNIDSIANYNETSEVDRDEMYNLKMKFKKVDNLNPF